MAGNSFGTIYKLTTFGESHGPSIGGIIDGCPAGVMLNLEDIQKQLDRRKPGQSKISTPRKEEDQVQFLSGIFEGKTTGTPIGFTIANKDFRSKDYDEIKKTYRPGHADLTYEKKYGHRDYRGGGRSSARETACRVVAGAIAKQILNLKNIEISAYVERVEKIATLHDYKNLDLSQIDDSIVRCPDPEAAKKMVILIEEARKDGDSLGGMIKCIARNVPVGLGEPVFDKLNADLAKAMVSINAVKSFEIGSGITSTYNRGSVNNDEITSNDQEIGFKTNNSGGILGGLSNGDDIVLSIGFKPVSTIRKIQESIDNENNPISIVGKGRHDPCVLPRAVPIVESMAAIVLLDHLLRNQTIHLQD